MSIQVSDVMKKFIFFSLLFFSSVVHAEWKLIASHEDGTEFFIETTSITLVNQYKRAWIRAEMPENSKFTTEFKNRSLREYREFDCREKRSRQLTAAYFKKPNLTDIDDQRNEIQEWRFVAPKTIMEPIFNFVCNRK